MGYGIASPDTTNSYIHGDVNWKLVDGTKASLAGESLKALSKGFRNYEYYLGNYELTVNKVPGTSSYRDTWSLSNAEPFEFGLGALGLTYEARITSGLIFNNVVNAAQDGSYTLRSGDQVLEVSIFSSHLTYRLDLDGDGIYEIESMLDKSEY